MSLCGQMKRLIVAFALLPAIAQAHGGGGHLKGMLSAFDDQKLTILLDQKDKSIVGIDRETRFEQDNRAVELTASCSCALRSGVHGVPRKRNR